MSDSPYYHQSKWHPLDLGPGLALFNAARNQQQENARKDEYLAMERDAMKQSSERHSAEVARQKAEDERKHAIEAGNAMDTLARAARSSIGLGNMRGKPYGVQFQEGHDLPANVEGPELSPEAEAARQTPRPHETVPAADVPPQLAEAGSAAPDEAFFSDSGGPQLPPGSPGPQDHTVLPPMAPSGHQPGQGLAGLDVNAVANNAGFADRVRLAQSQAAPPDLPHETPEAPANPLAAAAANTMGLQPGPEGKRRIYANYQGQRFEVPDQKDTTPFGKDYDAIYQGLLEAGEDPHKAMAVVAAEYKSDQTQSHIASRTADQIEARRLEAERSKPDVSTQSEFLDRRLHQSDVNSRRAANAHIAGAAPGLKQEGANDRLFTLLDRRAKAVRDTGLFGKLAANDKVVRGIATNLASGTEGLQHKDAQIQLARYFRQAQPTEGEMHMLYDKLGGWTDSFNQFKAKVTRGDLSPEQLRQMQKSAKAVLHEHDEDKKRFYQVARSGLGPKSGLDEIPDQAQQQFDMMAAELGIEPGALPPLYQTEGGVTLGTGKAPKTQPRGTKKTQLDEIESYLDSLGGVGGR